MQKSAVDAEPLNVEIAREALTVLAQLVAFDTTSSDTNLSLIAYVENYLAAHGVSSKRIANAAGTKANLVATVGPGTDGGVVLSGHTDVVPVTNQPWSSDPFQLTRRGDRLYGRGTSDMKSFIALAMAAVPALQRAPLQRPVHLAFSYDEEIGCLGAPHLIQHIVDSGYRPLATIVGEPTSMTIVNSHKSIHFYELVIRGREAHSSLVHEGVSANMIAIDLLAILSRIAKAEQQHHRDARFEPEWSTLTVGMIHGGTAANILARECRFVFDLRCIPGRDAEQVLKDFWDAVADADAKLKAAGADMGIAVRALAEVPGLRYEKNGAAEKLCAKLQGLEDEGTAVPYGAEAGQFQAAGFSTVICGPGSIAQAHKPDEFIEVSQIEAGARFMSRLVDFVRTQ
ncbi:acetylornithine deacetylase [Steroidobacter cummioxidans]|uniref:acetylornithine deacetylase n=1 Tax=Steroidobacter cummioxidans TaxID=1803913 RepID=UPI000E313842|nr:acetylornithine deacetylase [Steroidobacter cummioxidans]